MLSRASRRTRRRALTCAALAALALSALLAPAAPAAVRSNALISVTGTHNFGALGIYAISGRASITSLQQPSDPCSIFQPVDPCRVLTIATVVRAAPPGGGNSCSFTGTTTQTVAVADTYSVDAIVVPPNPIVPGNPVVPGNPICPQLGSFAVRFNLAISPDNTITSVVAQTEPVT